MPPWDKYKKSGSGPWAKYSASLSGAGGSWEESTKVGEMPRGSEIWEGVSKPLIPEGKAEKGARAYADSPPPKDITERGSFLGGTYNRPRVEGLKRAAAGTYADTMETIRGFTSPVAIGTVGLGKLAEAPGAAGKIFKALSVLSKIGFTGQGVKQAAQGDLKTPEGIRNLLQGSGQAIIGARELPSEIGKEIRITGQEVSGAGKEPVLQAKKTRDAVVKERDRNYSEHVSEIARDNAQRLQEHQTKVQEAKAAYDKEFNEYKAAEGSKRAAHAEKVSAARKDWVEKAYAAKKAKAEAAAAHSQAQSIVKGQQAYSKVIKDNVDSTYSKVLGSLNGRWNGLRDSISDWANKQSIAGKGERTQLSQTVLANAIGKGREMLMGAPADLKIFNDLMRQMEIPNEQVGQEVGGTEPLLRPLDWQEGRTHFSAFGEKLYSGELPGNVARAIRYVRDEGLGSELSRIAKDAGQGRTYSGLLSDWSKFEDDWRNLGSVAGGGSPLARVRAAKDPGFVSQQALGKAGERMAETLGRYSAFGGNAGAVSRLRSLSEKGKSIPRVRVPSAPGKFEAPAEPKSAAPPDRKPEPKAPTLKTTKPYRSVPEVDPVQIRRDRLLKSAGRPFGMWETAFVIPALKHLALKSPAIREWIATQERKELTPP